jgi:hypothetical protein
MPIAFRERPAKSIVFAATIRPNAAPPSNTVEANDDVKLYADGFEVFVKVTQKAGNGAYRGTIIGANTRGQQRDDLKAGTAVEFEEKHIFTCSKRQV